MFEIFRARSGPNEGKWMWSLRLSAAGRVIALSESTFSKRSAVIADIERVKKLAGDAPLIEVIG